MTKQLTKLLSVLVLGILIWVAPTAQAIDANELTVSPAQIATEISADKPDKTETITVTNTYLQDITLALSLQAIDEQGGRFVPSGQLSPELEKSIILSSTLITVPSRGSSKLQVVIRNTDRLPPGGHYASLVLSQVDKTGKKSGIAPAISINIFFVKRGGEREALEIKSINTNGWLFRLPSEQKLELKNTGNVMSVPRGSTDINQGTTLIKQGVLNTGSLPLLPDKSNTFTTSLKNVSGSRQIWPTKITITTTYRASTDAEPQAITSTGWYIPWPYLLTPLFVWGLYRVLRKLRTTRRSKIKSDEQKHVQSVVWKTAITVEHTNKAAEKVVVKKQTMTKINNP